LNRWVFGRGASGDFLQKKNGASVELSWLIDKVLPVCSDAALDFALNGINHAMNSYNKPVV